MTTRTVSSAASASSTTTADTSDPSAILKTITPISDCPSWGGSYKTLMDPLITFTISCTTDFLGDDMLGVYVYTMEACMEACASYNSHEDTHSTSCGAVSYDTTMEQNMGNCFLKENGQNITERTKKTTISARLDQGDIILSR